MNIAFTPKSLTPIRGVRKADKATNRRSFCGVVPWFDLDNLMAPSGQRGSRIEGLVEFESLLEHDFLVLIRSDGITTSVRPQPRKVSWWDPRSQRWRVHTPDFALRRRFVTKPVYVQVKPKVVADEMADELALIEAGFRAQGLTFEVWTDEVIRRQPRFANAELLFDQSGPLEDVEALDRVRSVLREAAPSLLTIGQVREVSGIGSRAMQAVLRLHMRREVDLNLERPIDACALVRPTFLD